MLSLPRNRSPKRKFFAASFSSGGRWASSAKHNTGLLQYIGSFSIANVWFSPLHLALPSSSSSLFKYSKSTLWPTHCPLPSLGGQLGQDLQHTLHLQNNHALVEWFTFVDIFDIDLRSESASTRSCKREGQPNR